jgi:hypothetical protein
MTTATATFSKKLSAITNALLDAPASPVVGRGNERVCFPRPRKGAWKQIWQAIPKNHKHHLKYSAGGSLKWRKCNGNVVISPEAASVLRLMGLMG